MNRQIFFAKYFPTCSTEIIENRKLISSFMGTQQNTNLVYKGKDYHIYGWSVTPYPATPDTIKLEDYSLELVLSEVN